MSGFLVWRPVNRSEDSLPRALKWALLKEYGNGQGGLPQLSISDTDQRFMGFLAGLEAAGVDGAQDLLEIMDKHGEIELWVEF